MNRAALSLLTSIVDRDDESGVRARALSAVSLEPFAAGGMASVHLVAGGADGQLLALKRLHPHLAKDAYFTSMLADEAAIASAIRHENVVTTYGLSVYDGSPCVLMNYVPGLIVSDVIRHAHPFGVHVPFALKIAANALRGLHAAHQTRDANGHLLDIVHRDVSPQNILVGTDGIARVLDFGIAKAVHRIHSTRPGEVKGKLAYMAPEQLMGEALDARTDLRGVGVVLWEMLTGTPLFHSKREEDCIAKIVTGRVRRPSELARDIPPEVDAIVMRALALRPIDRFQTALEMAEALEEILVGHLVTAEQLGNWIQAIGYDVLDDRERFSAELLDSMLPPTTVRRDFTAPPPPAPKAPKLRKIVEPALLFLSAVLASAGGTFYLRSWFR